MGCSPKICATDSYALDKFTQANTISLAFCLAPGSVPISACMCSTQPTIPGKNLSERLGLYSCFVPYMTTGDLQALERTSSCSLLSKLNF